MTSDTRSSHVTGATPDAGRLLRLYLRDHDGASTGGVDLVQRCLDSNRDTEFVDALSELAVEIRADQRALRSILRQLRVDPSRAKRAMAWCVSTIGRLKLNGRIVAYSPLSRLVEIEALSAAVTAKRCLWSALADLATTDGRLDEAMILELQQRAVEQLDELSRLHRTAADLAFAHHPSRVARS